MKTKGLALFSVLFFGLIAQAFAGVDDERSSDIHVLIAPVIGYQFLSRTVPYDHSEGMLTYGARVVVGTYELAGEAEFQYGDATESFSNPDLNIDTSYYQVRLGLRKVFPITEPLHLLARAGIEGFKYTNSDMTDTASYTDSQAWQFRPYVGGGVILYLFKALSLSVEEVYVFGTSWETGVGFRLFI